MEKRKRKIKKSIHIKELKKIFKTRILNKISKRAKKFYILLC